MIAIKDTEMPKNCAECIVRRECKQADEWDEFDWYYGGRLDGCPLVEIEERKVGKWIRVDHTKVKCSNCDITHLIAQYPHGVIDYCPNCGSYNQSIIENER